MHPPTATKVARRGINYSLDRLNKVLKCLDYPHQHCPPTLHIAGTNGKGSVAHYLSHATIGTGLNVLCYTSPHIHSYNERFCINHVPISNDAFDDAFQQVHDADTDDSLSEYEVLTIMAFLLCQSHDIDLLILETGLGGRLDATNVVPSSTAIITDISFDHCDILGHTMAEIAAEKAGIIKPHSTIITHHDLHADALSQIETQASSNHASLILTKPSHSMTFHQRNKHLAKTACQTIDALQNIASDQWATIIDNTPPPHGRLTKTTLQESPCWMDVGHNLCAAQAIAQALPNTSHHWIIGMQSKKDPITTIDWLLSHHHTVSICEFDPDICLMHHQLPASLQSCVSKWRLTDPINHHPIFFGSFFFIEWLQKSNYNN